MHGIYLLFIYYINNNKNNKYIHGDIGLAFQNSLYCRYKNNYQHKKQSVLAYVLNKSNEPFTSSVPWWGKQLLIHSQIENTLHIHWHSGLLNMKSQ